jgi:protein required for attachment to host cells
VSADTTTISSDVETINVDDEEGDAQSPKATTSLSPGKQAVETPHQTSKTQGRSMSSTDPVGDLGSHKRMKKAPPKPCKPGLRSATK